MVDPLMASVSSISERTRVRRSPDKQHTDRAVLDAVLDANVVAHVGLADDSGMPFVLPCAYARDGDRILLHGSTASRMFRRLADGAATCIAVTTLDAMVVARSAFESSMHYRSAMVFGHCAPITDDDDHLNALRLITEHLLPGRWKEVRNSHAKELKATSVVAMPIAEWSVKISDGEPDDAVEDIASDTWAGILPIDSTWGQPRPANNLRTGLAVPASVTALVGQRVDGRHPDERSPR